MLTSVCGVTSDRCSYGLLVFGQTNKARSLFILNKDELVNFACIVIKKKRFKVSSIVG